MTWNILVWFSSAYCSGMMSCSWGDLLLLLLLLGKSWQFCSELSVLWPWLWQGCGLGLGDFVTEDESVPDVEQVVPILPPLLWLPYMKSDSGVAYRDKDFFANANANMEMDSPSSFFCPWLSISMYYYPIHPYLKHMNMSYTIMIDVWGSPVKSQAVQ
jgi:hypothetical protein